MQTMKRRLLVAILFAGWFFSAVVFAADLNFPYARFDLKLPPAADPFPGLGTNYSTLSNGMQTVLWNPASLAKLSLSEASIALLYTPDSSSITKSFKMKELGGAFSTTSGGTNAGSYGIFFRTPEMIGSGVNTKEVEIATQTNYASSPTAINFASALKVNDWLAVGVSTNGPSQANISLAGTFPFTARTLTNFYGQSVSGMEIQTKGKLKYTFSAGGISTTYESVSSLWSGFLSQEATIPLTSLSELRNDINFETPYVGTVASKIGNLNVGLNLLPISANLNINNVLRSMINSGSSDIFLYTPNFDKNNQSELANWINDPDKYGSAAGYQRKQINLHAGEIIANAEYKGFYSASTTRLDLGAMYDVADWLTLGFAMDNLNSSALNFKGSGISTYLNYRNIDTNEAASVSDIFQPGGKTTINLLTDTWTTTTEVSGTALYLQPEKTVNIPKKTRLGLAFKRPFLICLDYEQNQGTITLSGSTDATSTIISNLNLLRVGLESQLFALPAWIRFGTALMLKPSVAGGDQSTQNSVNNLFKFGVLPAKLDIGTSFNLWGYKLESGAGYDLLPIINLLQGDFEGSDLNKTSFLSMSLQKDAWQLSYLMQVDALSSASTYYTKPVAAGEKRTFSASDIKYMNTLSVAYHF